MIEFRRSRSISGKPWPVSAPPLLSSECWIEICMPDASRASDTGEGPFTPFTGADRRPHTNPWDSVEQSTDWLQGDCCSVLASAMINLARFRRTTFCFVFVGKSDTGSGICLPICFAFDHAIRVSRLDPTRSSWRRNIFLRGRRVNQPSSYHTSTVIKKT